MRGPPWYLTVKEREATKRTSRVDRIGAPNLGIRICRLICGFHRNCLSTRCLHAPGPGYIHLLYVSPHETRAVARSSRVFTHHPDFGTFIVGRSVVYTSCSTCPFSTRRAGNSGGASSRGRKLISFIVITYTR